jgi:hypothetical protein
MRVHLSIADTVALAVMLDAVAYVVGVSAKAGTASATTRMELVAK